MRAIYLLLALLAGCTTPGYTAPLPILAPIRAVLGESEGEGFKGMLAVACTIRHRGNLKGVYGLRAFRVTHRLYSAHSLVLAEKAWAVSAHTDTVNGATGWGSASDIELFKHTSWWKHMRIVAHVGHHWFYRRVS